ncbi:NfeD family protein [Nocardioides sambongensis]|uniref:NfeD family protein n=1 Tax=Nocardioides sambongensis TaxID=2589074 RepID=UPI00112A187E|nr:NfeD family protein [Nocardioides sambongensis]
MDWLRDHLWEAWLGAAILLGVAEMFSLDLILAMLAAGALAGMGTALVTDSVGVQVLVASVVSVAMLAVVRPSLARRFHGGPDLVLGNARVVGLEAVVTEPISSVRPGRVKLDGEIWTASADTDLRIGERVEVLEIRGATAVVRPRALPEPPSSEGFEDLGNTDDKETP